MSEIQELRIVFAPDGIQYHVTYTHKPDAGAASASGASVAGRSHRAKRMTRAALHEALNWLESPKSELLWLGYGTNYLRTTDSIGVDK